MRSWKNGTPETARKPWSNGENMSKGISIPFEAADLIALASMQSQLKYLRKEVKDHLEKGAYLHPEDLGNSVRYIHALETLIPYYGGDLDD